MFTMDGRALRLSRTATGWSAQVRVLGDHWTDAAAVTAAISGRLPGRPSRTGEAACAAALDAASLPAFARATREFDHRHLVEVFWWDEQLFATIWDSIAADRDAHWELDLTPDQATAFAHALWLASGGELAREPVRIGPLT